VSSPAPTQRLVLELGAGERIVGDHLPGTLPGYLYLHGMGSVRAGEKSARLLDHAAQKGRAFTRFDFRGHGESSGQMGQVTIREILEDTAQVLRAVGPCVLVGSSLGGLVGTFVTAQHADLVVGLTLLAPAFGLLARLEHRLDPQGRMWTSDGRSFHLAERVAADARTLDESSLPGRIHVPTLVVHGTADEVVPPAASERLFAALATPRKELWLVPGGGHRLNEIAAEIGPRTDALVACWRG